MQYSNNIASTITTKMTSQEEAIASDVGLRRKAIWTCWQNLFMHLEKFAALPENWDAEGADAPDRSAIYTASIFLRQLSKDPNLFESPPSLKLSPDGDIVLTWQLEGREYVQYVIEEQGHVELLRHREGETIRLDEMDIEADSVGLPHRSHKITSDLPDYDAGTDKMSPNYANNWYVSRYLATS